MNNSKLFYGIGINDKTRPARVNSKAAKQYALWRTMLKRCYDLKCHTKQPTYIDCEASDNFKSYSYFYDWCNKQIGFNLNGWQLDKDILIPDNKTYSEDSCVFVPQDVNKFFANCGAVRSNCPVGVDFHKASGKYRAVCRINSKQQHLGLFNNPEAAFVAYKAFKEAVCKDLANKYQDRLDERVFNYMMNWKVTFTY